jgi:sugar/nucleoside kinase (ribokinase family)
MVLGDAMLDIVTEPETESADLEYMEVSISFQVGGSGVHLASAAADMGFAPVSLVCSLGADEAMANRTIKAALRAKGISLVANFVEDCRTGITIIGYSPTGSRILMTEPGANRNPLTDSVIAAACAALTDVVVVSGYMLFRSTTRNGTSEIMRQASRQGSLVVLDLVPHSLHQKMSLAELRSSLDFVDFVAGAFSTFTAFGISIETLLSEVEGVLAYWPDGTYRFANRTESDVIGEFQDPIAPTTPRGMSERLLIWVLRNYVTSQVHLAGTLPG